MSLVVANASSGPTTITLSPITVSGIVTVKDSGSASGTNTVTIQATAGNTFESGLTSYVLNTASAYMTFVGNVSTLKWRVLGSTYADIPVVSPVPSPPALGGNLSATLNSLSATQASVSSLSLTGNANIRALTTNSGFAPIAAGQIPLVNSRGLCFDPSGNMYVNDTNKYVIYKINPQGLISLFAGSYGVNNRIDGIGSAAAFGEIWQMSYDSYSGWIIIATVPCIRAMNPATAQVITLCGSTTTGNAPGLGAAASFQAPGGVYPDGAGNIYVGDINAHNICKVSYSLPITANGGTKTIIAGPTAVPYGSSGYYNNATGTSATFNGPRTLVINSSKTLLWVVDHINNVIRQVSLTSPFAVTTYAGDVGSSATPGNTTSPTAATTDSSTASSVRFNGPNGIAIDASNNLFIIDYLGNRLRYINTNTFFTLTLAGNGTSFNISGVGANGVMAGPTAVALDPNGSPWIATFSTPGILNYNLLTGYLSVYWTSGVNALSAYTLQNTAISTISMPGITTANIYGSGFTTFNQSVTYRAPLGVLMDSQNNLYVGDFHKLRKVTPSGFVTSIYGDPANINEANFPGTGTQTQFGTIYQMCFDTSGNMYFCDHTASKINRFNLATGTVTQLPVPTAGDGTGLLKPMGILFNNNTLYIANREGSGSGTSSSIISVNLATNAVTLMAGQPTSSFGGVNNATGTLAKFNGLTGICFDATKSNILAADYGNNAIRVISLTPPYAVSSLSFGGSLSVPYCITMDSQYNIYLTQQAAPVGVIKIPYTGSYSSPTLSYGTASHVLTMTTPQGITVDTNNIIYAADSTTKLIYSVSPSGATNTYSGLTNIEGTKDSLFASSITLMAPYVGVGTTNPQAALQVVGSNVIVPGTYLTTSYPDVYFSVLSYCPYQISSRVMMEIGSTNTGTGNYGCTYKYLMGFSNTTSGTGGNFIIQSVNTTNPSPGYNTTATPNTLLTLNNTGLALTGGFHDIAANGNTNNDIVIGLHHHDNPAVNNERQFISCSPTLNDISIAAGCHSYGANWNPYNTAGTPAVSFVSCRKGLVKIYTGNMTGATADSGLTGTLTASGGGNWVYSSDERIKENITPLENCLEFVKSVRTVKYSFIHNNSSVPTQIGFLAQDFQASFPEVVSGNDGHLGLSYSDTIPIAVAAIKELNTVVESQASTIAGLQTTIAEILAKI